MKSNLVTIKRNVVKNTLAPKFILLGLFSLTFVIASILMTYTTYATAGNELEDLEKQKRELTSQNIQLTLDIAKSKSLPQIEMKAKELGMAKNQESINIKAK